MQRTDSFEKTLMLGKIGGGRRREQQRISWLDGITDTGQNYLAQLKKAYVRFSHGVADVLREGGDSHEQ